VAPYCHVLRHGEGRRCVIPGSLQVEAEYRRPGVARQAYVGGGDMPDTEGDRVDAEVAGGFVDMARTESRRAASVPSASALRRIGIRISASALVASVGVELWLPRKP